MRKQRSVWIWTAALMNVLFAGSLWVSAGTVFDNTAHPVTSMAVSTNEFGDDMQLGGNAAERTLTQLKVQYYCSGVSGVTENARLRLYQSTGTNHVPGALLYDSGLLPIETGYNFLIVSPNIPVPDELVWTVQFSGLAADKMAGLLLTDPPTTGASSAAYMEKIDGAWIARYYATKPGNFYALAMGETGQLNLPPSITVQPLSQTALAGETATFNVIAGGSIPLFYQWYRDEVVLAGATNAILVFTNLNLSHSGSYTVVVSNSISSVTSTPAALAVLSAPQGTVVYDNTLSTNYLGYTYAVTNEFGDQITLAGNPQARKVTLFKFEYNLNDIGNGNAKVRVRFYDNTGNNATPGLLLYESQPLSLSSGFNYILLQPNVTVPNTFTWTVRLTDIQTNQVVGLSLYDPPTMGTSGMSYWEKLDGNWLSRMLAGIRANFAAQVIADLLPEYQVPAILVQPQSLTVTNGDPAYLAVNASGATPLAYQWFFKGAPVANATKTSLNFMSATTNHTGIYTVVITNIYGAITSQPVFLEVLVPPMITSAPQAQVVAEGDTAHFSVAAIGTAPLSYQWRKAGADLPGATNNTLLLGVVTTNHAGGYTVTIRNLAGVVTSGETWLTVVAPPTVRSVYDNSVQYLDEMYAVAHEVGDEVLLEGTVLERTLSQFQFAYFLGNTDSNNAAATVRFYDDTGLNHAPGQLLYTSAPLSLSAGTNWATVTPFVQVPDAVIWTVQFSGLAAHQQAGLLLFHPPAVGSSANLFWEKPGQQWIAKQFTETPGNFGARIIAGPKPVLPVLSKQPQSQTLAEGQALTLQVTVTNHYPLSYQWEKDGTVIAGATNDSLMIGQIQSAQAGVYRVAVSNVVGTVTSDPATVAVITGAPVFLSVPQSQSVSSGSLVSFRATAQGENLRYQWRLREVDLAGATNATLWLTNVSAAHAGLYSVRLSNPVAAIVSPPAALSVVDLNMVAGLLIAGPIGKVYRIECLEALDTQSNWVTQATVTLTNSPQWYFDTQSPARAKRFYRAIWIP